MVAASHRERGGAGVTMEELTKLEHRRERNHLDDMAKLAATRRRLIAAISSIANHHRTNEEK